MHDDLFSLAGRRALVTGANSGIGTSIALALARYGADLAVHHFQDPDGAAKVCAAASENGRRASLYEADLSEAGSADELAAAVLREGPVDLLVVNAAVEHRRPWEELSGNIIMQHVAVNFTATITLAQRLVPRMTERGWGRVVAIGSVLASRPRAETLAYASMKSAQLTAMRAIGREVASYGVTMNVISPGAIETERNAHQYADPGFRRRVNAKIPAGRAGSPADCVAPVLMLCGPGGAYITGADIPVDGGWAIGDAPMPV